MKIQRIKPSSFHPKKKFSPLNWSYGLVGTYKCKAKRLTKPIDLESILILLNFSAVVLTTPYTYI